MMKRILLAAAAGLVLASALAQAAQPVDDEAALRQIEQTWVRATATGDRATLATVLDDSYTDITPQGRHRTRQDVLSAPSPAFGSSQTLIEMNVRVTGDSAVVTGINQYRQSATDKPRDFSFTDVFVRRDGTWRAVASQMTRY